MTKQCSVHENRVGYVCLYKGCDTAFLCRKCYKDHPEDHDSFVKELHEIQENPEWIKPYENERDLLALQGKEVYSLNEKVISKYETCLEEMIDQIAKGLEKHKNKLLRDLIEFVIGDKDDMDKGLYSNLEENMKNLQTLNFRDGDDIEKVIYVKEFNEKIAPSVISAIQLIEKKFEDFKLDQVKINRYKDELIELIESVNVRNFCPSNAFQSIKDYDALSALTKANEEMAQSLEKLEKEMQELKGQNNNLNSDQAKLKEENRELLRISNLLENELQQLKQQFDESNDQIANLSEENNKLQKKVEEFKVKNGKLIQDQVNLKTENDELLEMKDLLKNQIDGVSTENIKLREQSTQLKQKVTDLSHKVSNLEEENKIIRDQARSLDTALNLLEPKQNLSLGWSWSSAKKSSKISLSENSMQATKKSGIGSAHYAGVIGSREMSHGYHQWEIKVSCVGPDKSKFAFGVIKPNLINDIEGVLYCGIVGLALNGNALKAKLENMLSSYDGKVFLCSLDCDAGIFTISHGGILVCREEGDLKNQVLVPIVVMYEPGSTATLRSIV